MATTETGSSPPVRLSHMLFLAAGALLGYATAGVAIPSEPNTTQVIALAVLATCILVIAGQSERRTADTDRDQD